MPLEAAVIIEYSRNGDYAPSRLEAQIEAAQFLAGCRRTANVENSVALMCTTPPTLLVSLTSSDAGRFSAALSSIRIGPSNNSSLDSSLRIASLALKHRQNGNQKARIIAFVASPLLALPSDLVKGLKKSGIALNIVSLGSEAMLPNRPLLEDALAVLDDSTSTLTQVEPTTLSLNDVLRSVPELIGQDANASPASADFYGGVDPELDPELALALKLSLEEEQARLARENKKGESVTNSDDKKNDDTKNDDNKNDDTKNDNQEEDDEELQRAIQMSMQQQQK